MRAPAVCARGRGGDQGGLRGDDATRAARWGATARGAVVSGREAIVAWLARLPVARRRVVLALCGVASAALAAALIWRSRFAAVRVVHTQPEPAWLRVDGGRAVRLDPVSTETPEAGVSVALPPGRHRLVVSTAEGVELDVVEATLAPRASYLFGPAAGAPPGEQCFWVEHTAYGQARPTRPPLRSLLPELRLWQVPDEVDAWFFATPPPSERDHRSSGGTRTAVRQSRCGFEPWR